MTLASSFPLLLDLLLKSAVILLLAGSAGFVCRRASSANRHMIWLAALVVLLLSPVTRLANPPWSYVWSPHTKRVTAAPAVVTRVASPISVSTDAADVTPPSAVRRSWSVNGAALGVVVWLVGMGAVLLHRTGVRWRLARLAARSRPVSVERWRGLVDDWPAGVEIRESTECRVPLAAGVWRPVVLLPTAALHWSEARLVAALRHEFGHIRRRDCLSRLLLDLACALYWMNPLVWFTARSMRLAQEQACDDLVLRRGASAADYATQLVDAVRGLGGATFPVRHALAMAQPSTLETRVRAIVEAGRDRSTMSRATSVLGAVAALFALALCGVVRVGAAEKRAAPKPEAGGEKSGVQIAIEAKFFEIAEESLGVLGASLGPDGVPPPNGAGGGIVSVLPAVSAGDISKSLGQAKGVDVLSTPRVTTRSGQQAVIEIVREFRYPTEYDKNQKTGQWEPKAFETKNVGITFGVRATAAADGTLDLELAPEVVELKGSVDLDAPGKPMISAGDPGKPGVSLATEADFGNLVPAGHRAQPMFSTRKITTSVSIFAGQSVLLEVGAPKETKDARKRRLFVLVTPEIFKPKVAANSVVITSNSIVFDKATGAVTASGDVKVETADATILAQKAEVRPKSAAPAVEKSAAMEKAEKTILPKMEFRDATVREAVAFLMAQGRELDPEKKGVNIVLKLPETDTTTITLSLENVPLSEALNYVAELAGLKVDAGADGFVLRGGAPAAALVEPAAGTPEAQLLGRARGIVVPKIVFRDATVAEAAEFLRVKARELDLEKKAVNIIVMPSKANPDVRISLDLSNVPLAEALRYVAQLSNHKLEISPSAFVLRPIE